MRRRLVVIATLLCAGALSGEAAALGNAQWPGLQVALYRHGFYKGPIDGIPGPLTRQAVVDFQRARRLEPDGVPGKRTLAAFGPLGRPLFGSRMLARGMVGFDVSVLQFLLARHGFATDSLNSNFGPVTEQRVRAFQRKAGLAPDGVVGPKTHAALLPPRGGHAQRRAYRRHVVQPGETLTGIAERTGTTVQALARLNRLDPGRFLIAGSTILVPAPRARSR
jgi:peptidoglycan hydrolase-like protein with peptidoglycan-binding domain